ncbi:MAG TPA: DUF2835 domain-containing protein [Gammaproteobacteria bacterium]
MNNQREIIFSLNISADDYLEYYKGRAKHVLAQSQDGRSVRFPANALQKFLTHDGVHGRFRLLFDENHKLTGIEKIGN